MKRCTFHVPVAQVLVASVIAIDADEARAKLDRSEDVEFINSFPGTTASGQIELIGCIDIAPKRSGNKGENDEQV